MTHYVPPPPRLPTRSEADTEPPDESIAGAIRELRGALRNACELMVKLETRLLQHEISILTVEHQEHHAHDRIDALAKRVDELEQAAAAAE
jgi:hypothetical protein